TATSIYPPDATPTLFGSAGAGGVYKINGTTFTISPFTSLAGVGGASLGNICYDKANDQFFISELDGGTIRCVNNVGTQVASFDHGTTGRANQSLSAINDTSGPGALTNPGRRVFGLQVYQGRLYYAVWDNTGNAIWSVGVVSGNFVSLGANGPKPEINGSILQSALDTPITDIAFSQTGKMLLAERYLCVNSQTNLNTGAQNPPV